PSLFTHAQSGSGWCARGVKLRRLPWHPAFRLSIFLAGAFADFTSGRPAALPRGKFLKNPLTTLGSRDTSVVRQMKKSLHQKAGPKRRRGRSKAQPQTGSAPPGETFDPQALPEEREPHELTRGSPRPAPAPGVPISSERYEWLKKKARAVRRPPSEHGQEDPAGEKEGLRRVRGGKEGTWPRERSLRRQRLGQLGKELLLNTKAKHSRGGPNAAGNGIRLSLKQRHRRCRRSKSRDHTPAATRSRTRSLKRSRQPRPSLD